MSDFARTESPGAVDAAIANVVRLRGALIIDEMKQAREAEKRDAHLAEQAALDLLHATFMVPFVDMAGF